MLEHTENSSTASASGTELKPKRTRGILNKTQMNKLSKAEDIAHAAQKEDYAPLLEAREISEEFTADLIEEVDSARTKAAEAVHHTNARKSGTVKEKGDAYALIHALQEVQKAAKQKYARKDRPVLGDYFVGKKLNGNRANLLQTSQSIVTKVGADSLPGITAAKSTKLKNLRATWIASNNAQGESTRAAVLARAELRRLLESIEDSTVAIQLAADAQWPHTNKDNAAIRREFGLSPRTPLVT